MVVVHTLDNKDELKVNYKDLLSSWAVPLVDIIQSEYMDNLIWFIDQKYKSNMAIFPKEIDDIFKCFQDCEYEELKVVIIGKQPYINIKSNGLAYGMKDTNVISPPSLKNIEECIRQTTYRYKDTIPFDFTLETWSKQGMLLLNTALTSEFQVDHDVYWRHFTRFVIKHINKHKNNVAFVFLDNTCDYFKQFIDTKYHKIFENNEITVQRNSSIFSDLEDYVYDKHRHLIKW